MTEPHGYAIKVRCRTIDGDVMFEARVRELPDLAEYADTAEEACALALDAVTVTAQMLGERGRPMPLALKPTDELRSR